MSQTLIKQPNESRLYSMDFSANLASGETISSITSVTPEPTGPTISSEAVSSDGKSANFRIAGGTDGESYKITVIVVTSSSNTLEDEGILLVKDL